MQNKFKAYRNFLYECMLTADDAIEYQNLGPFVQKHMEGRSEAFYTALRKFNEIFDREVNKDE